LDIDFISEERYYLEKLSRYLNYELSSSVLLFLNYAWGFTFILAVIAAAVFVPFMLYVFVKCRKIAWMVAFIIVVAVPFTICTIFSLKSVYSSVLMFIALGFFYFYCFMLKFPVKDQLEEVIAREELQKKIEQEKAEQFNF
jgi:hypothetical protein